MSVLSQTADINNFHLTLLCTVLLNLSTHFNKQHMFTALLDSASQLTIIMTHCPTKISLNIILSSTLLTGISPISTQTLAIGKLNIYTLNSQLLKEPHKVIVAVKIKANLLQFDKFPELQDKLKNFYLSDPNFSHNSEISIIVGANLFALTLSDHTVHLVCRFTNDD